MRFLVSLFIFSFTALAQVPVEHVNVTNSEALSGYDPVSYFEGTPHEGKEELSYDHEGVVYRFASEANRQKFKANPSKFIPAYGGWCAYAMLDGDKVEVDPMSFKLIDGKVYLFYNGFWGNTLKKWNNKTSKTSKTSLVGQADAEWQKLLGE